MELQWRETSYGIVLQGLLVCAGLVSSGLLRVQSDLRLVAKAITQTTSPAIKGIFSCLQSRSEIEQKYRVAVLNGPDWVLEFSIRPEYFPERDVLFSVQVGEQFLPHPITARTRLWITTDQDLTHIRIVESCGSEKQDLIAVSFVANHHCVDRNNNQCSVKGGAATGYL